MTAFLQKFITGPLLFTSVDLKILYIKWHKELGSELFINIKKLILEFTYFIHLNILYMLVRNCQF
jgi:hypothetical protein